TVFGSAAMTSPRSRPSDSRDGSPGWAPNHSSASGVELGIDRPCSAAIAVRDPHAYGRIAPLRSSTVTIPLRLVLVTGGVDCTGVTPVSGARVTEIRLVYAFSSRY